MFPRFTAFTGLILTGLILIGLILTGFILCQLMAVIGRDFPTAGSQVRAERRKPNGPPELMS